MKIEKTYKGTDGILGLLTEKSIIKLLIKANKKLKNMTEGE